jgi:type II secretory pathway component PulF
VVLDIVAQSGAGQLLGNLLCAVAGLLDSGGTLSQLLGKLGQILDQLLMGL